MYQFPIPRICIFLSIGIALADQLRQHEAMPVYWGTFLISSLIATYFLRKKETLASLAFITSYIFLGALIMSVDWQEKRITLPEGEVQYEAVITSTPVFNNGKYTCDITTTSFQNAYKLKAYIATDTTINIGDHISCTSRWNLPRNFTSSSHFDYALYLKRHGYAATTFIPSATIVSDTSSTSLPFKEALQLYPLLLRAKALSILVPSHTTEDENQSTALIAAMILGEKSQLSPQTKLDYSAAGASHVLALSGLHISILLSILSIILAYVSIKLEMALQLFFVWAFAFLVGMPVSILRVAIMFSFIIIIKAIGYKNHMLNTLFFAASTILLISPQSLFDVGFQLSFTAVFFIRLFSRCFWSRIDKDTFNLHRKKLAFFNILLVSFAAQLGTLPLILYHFGQFPVYFLITNMFIGIFATIILSLGVLTIAISFIPFIYPLCQKILIFAASSMNDFIHFMASLPCSIVHDLYFNIAQVAVCYILIFLLIKPIMPKKFVN